MDALNKAERKKAFSNFLIFFIITAALIITAVIFSVQVPFSENNQLKEQMILVGKQRKINQDFQKNLNDFTGLFDTLDNLNNKASTMDPVLVYMRIEDKLKGMSAVTNSLETDSSLTSDPSAAVAKDLYNKTIINLSAYYRTKKNLRENTNKDVAMERLQNEIDRLKIELKTDENTIALYKNAASNANSQPQK